LNFCWPSSTFLTLLFRLPKAFPNDESDRFKLLLLAADGAGERLVDKAGALRHLNQKSNMMRVR
jgi:hypothetical protein